MIRRVFAFALLAYALGFAVFMVSLGHPLKPALHTDAIVVPTGGAGRIKRGLALLQQGTAQRMLVTGAGRGVKPVELARRYHVSPRLFACCIDLGHEAVDTRSNGIETARWMRAHGYHSVRLVTSNWHMPRARLELTHALGAKVRVIGDSVPSEPGFAMLFSEYNKYLVRRVALWLGV